MRFPWQKRADEEHVHVLHADIKLKKVQSDWPAVHAEADKLHRIRMNELDSWTATAVGIFSRTRPKESR